MNKQISKTVKFDNLAPFIIDLWEPNYNYWINQQPLTVQNVNKSVTKDRTTWSTDVSFSAEDNNIVDWTNWNIYLADWTTFTVSNWNTWDMIAVTYIFLNKKTSTLEITTNANNSVWQNKLLICVAWPVDDTNKKAVFQAFWSWSQSTFITADNIAANTITANEVAANTLTSNEIKTSTITITDLWDDDYKTWADNWYKWLNTDWLPKKIIDWTVLENTSPSATWLFMNSDKMWYYNKGDNARKVYIDKDWNFKFDWDDNNYVSWDWSSLSVRWTLQLWDVNGAWTLAWKDQAWSGDVTFNYADSSSKWWNAKDTDNVDWTAASDVKRWAWKADNALNSDNRYQKWLNANDVWESKDKSSYTWVIIDSDWLSWYNSWDKTFEIDNSNWSAYFKWTIWASSIESNWYIDIKDSNNNEIWLWLDTNPQIKFYDSWDYVWYLLWDSIDYDWTNYKLIKSDWYIWSTKGVLAQANNSDIWAVTASNSWWDWIQWETTHDDNAWVYWVSSSWNWAWWFFENNNDTYWAVSVRNNYNSWTAIWVYAKTYNDAWWWFYTNSKSYFATTLSNKYYFKDQNWWWDWWYIYVTDKKLYRRDAWWTDYLIADWS